MQAEVPERHKLGVDFIVLARLLKIGREHFLNTLLGVCGTVGVDVCEVAQQAIGVLDLFRNFLIKGLQRVVHRLIELLETVVDLGTVFGGYVACVHDKLVEVRDAAVLFGCPVDAMALLALLVALGTIVGDVAF
jgi:hypothetical protein